MELNTSSNTVAAISRLENVFVGICDFLSRHGITKSPRLSLTCRNIFLSWPKERLEQMVTRLEKILEIHLQAESEPNFDLDDSTRLLRIALQSIGLSIDPSFYKMIDRSDILEVYDNNHIQIFRSFNFFRICNYTLDDVLSHEWFELYERAESVTNEIMAVVTEHMESQRTITKVNLKPHVMRERFSPEQGSFVTRFKSYANIYSGPDQKQGFVVTIAAKPLLPEESNFDFIGSKRSANTRSNPA